MGRKKATHRTGRRAASGDSKSGGFTVEERAAMRERAREIRAESAGRKGPADGEREVLARITEMPAPDRDLAERLHAIVRSTAPGLTPRTWYGMPAYARDGKVVCFFQSAHKFKTRYSTLGFTDAARLDDGALWPVTFAIREMSAAEEETIRSLLARAVG